MVDVGERDGRRRYYAFDTGVYVTTTTGASIVIGIELTNLILLDYRSVGVSNFHFAGLDGTATRADVEAVFNARSYYRHDDSYGFNPPWWEVEGDWSAGGGYVYYVYVYGIDGRPGIYSDTYDGGWHVGISFDENDMVVGIVYVRHAT